MYGTHIALSHFVERRSGVIINIASSGGQQALPHLAVYGGCKAGVIGFSRSVAHDLVGLGIRINVVCPGTILSPQLQERARQAGEHDIAPVQYSLATTPLGRASSAEEVANVVAFLSSDAASAIHGAVYSVGGG
jgi:2-keto-3-deoxy-L-fuconate dehydrogenase